MIIIGYLVRGTFKSQLAALFIPPLISFYQKLVRTLGTVVDGDIPVNLVPSPLGSGMPEMAQLILPLNLFPGLLMTLGKLYTESEIMAIYAHGLSKVVLVETAMILAVLAAIVVVVNVMWAGPWSSCHQDEILVEAKANPDMAALAQGQFQQATDGNPVLFIENVDGSDFKDVFLAQTRPEGNARPSVVATDSGHLTQLRDGSQVIILDQGTCFEDVALLCDFRTTDLQDYQAITGHQTVTLDPNGTDQMNMRTLWNTDTDRTRAELNWRIMLVFTVFVMTLMVVSLSVVSSRQGHVLSMLPAMLLYLLFLLIQTSLKSNGGKGKLNPTLWMQAVNLVYLASVIVLNLWDTMPVHRLYASFPRKGVV